MAKTKATADAEERRDLYKELVELQIEQTDEIKEQGPWMSKLLGLDKQIQAIEEDILIGKKDGTGLDKDKAKAAANAVKGNQKILGMIRGQLGFIKKFRGIAKSINMILKANPLFLLVGIVVGLVTAFFKFQKAVAQTRKELGVSAIEAAKLEVRFIALGWAAKAWGLETEDIKSSFNAIRETFGGIDQATNSFVLNLAKAQLTTGATAEELAKIISIQESISDLSREALLQQTKTTAELIRQAGVAPSAIFRDIAENAEFFAKFAKEGGDNLVRAGIQARKLGLNMSAVAGVADSLLDFESSIEKQLTASVLLGRQINLDKARQLAMTNDMTGMMDEILRQVGGEAEFTAMNFKQREALADSVGVNVAQLTRLVKNQVSPEEFARTQGMSAEQALLSNIYGELQGHGKSLGGINSNTRRTDQKLEPADPR